MGSVGVWSTVVVGLAMVWSGGLCWVGGRVHGLGELWVSCLDPLKCLCEAEEFLLVGAWIFGEVHGTMFRIPLVGDADAIVCIFGWAYNSIENAGVES